jgi:tartrate dehydrogenase/decarboxylase/D-malate dehydrogenase
LFVLSGTRRIDALQWAGYSAWIRCDLSGCDWLATVPDHISLWELLLPIRQTFQQYANVRPVRLFPGLVGPLRDKTSDDINFVCVRENTEGEYAGVGGRGHYDTAYEVAIQTDVFARVGVERVMRYSFELARSAGKS